MTWSSARLRSRQIFEEVELKVNQGAVERLPKKLWDVSLPVVILSSLLVLKCVDSTCKRRCCD